MDLSIIIPNYNGAHLLAPCLDSIERQTYPHYDITVVDNGSTDASLELLATYGARVRVLALMENIGFSRAVNQGIRASRGELILVLNNDTTLDPGTLSALVNEVETYPDYGFYAPKILQLTNPREVYATGLMFSHRGYGNRSQRFQLAQTNIPCDVFGACGAAAIYRRSILECVGLFNGSFFFLYEDLELSFRHQLRGYKCLYLPSVVIYHRGSATLTLFTSRAVREAVKNSLTTLITCAPTSLLKQEANEILNFYLTFWRSIVAQGFAKELMVALLIVFSQLACSFYRRRAIQSQSVMDLEYFRKLLYRGSIFVNLPHGVISI